MVIVGSATGAFSEELERHRGEAINQAAAGPVQGRFVRAGFYSLEEIGGLEYIRRGPLAPRGLDNPREVSGESARYT